MPFDFVRRFLRLQWWEFRRRYYCPQGEHIWSYFGRVRVCRCCHREEVRDAAGQWVESAGRFASTEPTGVPHEPTNGN